MAMSNESYVYEPVKDEEHSDEISRTDNQSWYNRILKRRGFVILPSAVLVASIGISFLLGYKYNQLQHTRYDLESSVPCKMPCSFVNKLD